MKMVKTSLLAAAAGVLISPALMAADIVDETDTRDLSAEYLDTAVAADFVEGGILAVILDAEYANNDIITLTFTGDALDNNTLAPSIEVDPGDTTKGFTLGLISSNSGQAVYRVTDLVESIGPGAGTTIGVTVTIADDDVTTLEFDAQAVSSAGGVLVIFNAETNTGLALDTGGGDARSVQYLDVVTQFSVAAAKVFNGVIDVNADRLLFTAADEGTDEDSIAVTVGDDGDVLDLPATLVDVSYVVTGDFSWVFDTDPDVEGIQPNVGVFTPDFGCGDGDFMVMADAISWTCPTVEAALVIDVTANVDGDDNQAVLPAGPFAATVVVNYNGFAPEEGGEASTTIYNAGFGAWTLNGFQAKVAYMPFQTGISPGHLHREPQRPVR